MQDEQIKHSSNWVIFTIVSFAVAAGMMAIGIYNLEASFSAKGFYAMAAIMLVHTSVTLTKTLRDRDEVGKLHNRIEEARTEKLLMEVGKTGVS
ncbi:YiaA/YiaB family inner membrane protein [Labrenzia sp. OB1]|uniref:YiaA/YiaB family inner membrane protein n=1 Tax=Labrenzia sp. OB1 TaxID=1561204 RepID=UPI0007B1DDC8|nr:YiaA/YiaB family inner membrane protein [Labrenzia sp. OB1]KZM51507.1 YiaAB two helix domain-containing protein [Labrenzia sp. OB1]